ncbi:MAG: hypothetical protein JOZ73_03930 [Solirubrobacterales bacterium]|nr:hypothetical protein [Solirubrobacterales bacterium]
MALTEVEGPPGAPWHRPLAGALDKLVVESELLADNPLGDPARRPLYVYRSPGVASDAGSRVPVVYVLQGYGGQVDTWLARKPFDPTFAERLEELFGSGRCPEAIVVFVDAWTSLGGSQFLNSISTGRYADYICDEIVQFIDSRYPTLAAREHRGVCGHSSGGYGATVLSMLRPDVFGGFASHAGDALFESCYQRDFPKVARLLRDHFEGSFEVMLRELKDREHFDFSRFGLPLSIYAYSCAYSPDPERPGEALVPFEPETGRVVPEVWEQWLMKDPVRMAAGHADALRAMRRIYLDAGLHDEYFLDLGAQALSSELDLLGVEHSLELFDGGHGGIAYRYPLAIRELVIGLAA